MSVLRVGLHTRAALPVLMFILALIPAASWAQDYKDFVSEDYGFAMKYPARWVKIDKPKGNYYVVFQAPDLVDNFRCLINVAAHKPVKDPVNAFLQEFRNNIADLQKKASSPKDQPVRILDEGEFKSEIPGAYYFFIQAFEEKQKIWMDIVIVFFKQDQTLIRVSCLAPSSAMERFQGTFNDVLVSVRFPPAAPGAGISTRPPAPTLDPRVGPPETPAAPSTGIQPMIRTGPPSAAPESPPETRPQPPMREAPSPPAPRSGPRAPVREPERPATGIVN
jgi:hypothetical protein